MNYNEIASILYLLGDPDPEVYKEIKEIIIKDMTSFDKYLLYLSYLSEDPDPEVYNVIKDNIFKGLDASGINHTYFPLPIDNNLAKMRAVELIEEAHYKKVIIELEKYLSLNEKVSIAKLSFILETFFHKDISSSEIENEFNDIFKEIWIEINNGSTVIEKTKIINNILFNKLNFKNTGNNKAITLSNLDLAVCMQTRTYSSFTISLLYSLIAESFNLDFVVVNLKYKSKDFFNCVLLYFNAEIAKILHSETDLIMGIFPIQKGKIVLHDNKIWNSLFIDIDDIGSGSYKDLLTLIFIKRTDLLLNTLHGEIVYDYREKILKMLDEI